MRGADEYVPEPGDMVIFDRPLLEGSQRRVFQVADHDTETGMTSFSSVPRALSAQQMAELGASKAEWQAVPFC